MVALLTKTKPWDHQVNAFEHVVKRGTNGAMLAMGMGPQPLHSRILTPFGWKTIGDVSPGEQIIGSDGKSQIVHEVHDVGNHEIWKVITSDGQVIECSEHHLWTVRSQNSDWETLPLSEIARTLVSTKHWNRKWLLPKLSPVQFANTTDNNDLPIDPYVLGVLLADGTFGGKPGMGGFLRFTTSDVSVITEIKSRGYNVSTYPSNMHHGLTGLRHTEILEELGLRAVRSRDKFIPLQYKRSSIDNRRALLRGLMLDGGRVGRSWKFSTTSEQLAVDVSELVRSLGGSGSIRLSTKETYHVSLGLSAGTEFGSQYRQQCRRIVDVRRTGTIVPMRCLKVENDDGLYVTDGYVLTHNTGKTKVAIDFIQSMGLTRVLVVTGKKVLEEGVWEKQLALHATEAYGHARYLKLGNGNVKRDADEVKLADKFLYKVLIVHVNYESAWREPLASQLARMKFDAVILDESHRIKSANSRQSMYFARLAKVVPYRLCLTGTPMAHSPLDLYGQFRFLAPGLLGKNYFQFRARYAVMGGYQNHQVIGYQNENELNDKFYQVAFKVGDEVLDLPGTLDLERTFDLGKYARKKYTELEDQFYTEVKAGDVTPANAMVKVLRLQQVSSGYVVTDDRIVDRIDNAKAELFADILEDIGPEEPLVVFCRFHEELNRVLEICQSSGNTCVELSGRRNDVRQWQNGDAQVIAVQIQSGSEGIDLTRAAIAVYYSPGTSLKDYLQSRKRLDRPGQTRPVRYIHLIGNSTKDRHTFNALQKRQDVVTYILDVLRQQGPHG